jgi:hypothetical protein
MNCLVERNATEAQYTMSSGTVRAAQDVIICTLTLVVVDGWKTLQGTWNSCCSSCILKMASGAPNMCLARALWSCKRRKGIGIRADGTAGSLVYDDTVTKHDGAWRITARTITVRRQPLGRD